MRAARAVRLSAALLGAGLAAGCAQVLGVNGVEIGDGDGNGSGAGGHGGHVPEDCTNGKDDDGDGKTDCQDSECASYQCLDPAPMGWIGPVLADLASSTPAPCPKAAPSEALVASYGTITATPAQCSTCSCAVDGVVCALPSLLELRAAFCSAVNGSASFAITAANQCLAPPNLSLAVSYQGNPPGQALASKPSCKPSTSMPTTDTPAFASQARLCAPGAVGGGCKPQAVCAPKIGPNGASGAMSACITAPGDMDCPAGPYSVKKLVYGKADDTRNCSACLCGNPVNVKCNGTSTVYSDAACTMVKAAIPHTGACINSSAGSIRLMYAEEPPTGNCSVTPGGGLPMGGVMPADPHTLCCLP